ncbi:pyridoxamine 5'-phosphate oxidase family protein [Lipingzhangella sp. LS1_29]|uniref:Pyridoxamine 5'-phosphate oxidase family protein n=1 Tax=Lipingzhangella rawalii TaxID=2055835 RepID=A0ABU2H952_9ACTN|nr:pyridoxamine 5'-phosphate oxidase family protein [Lipingzhangella rawalii]MDS1271838.1 pyridoxamine 5'-phosphate oxidase family protein [Lipingzhangella rawalii]
MRTNTPTAELLFSDADASPMSTDPDTITPWEQARAAMEAAVTVWLGTVRPDGRPHSTPVVTLWLDDVPWFATRPGSQKGRNLAANPNCTLSVSSSELDLALEGTATREHAPDSLRRVLNAFATSLGWQLTLRDGALFDDALPGSPEYALYRISPTRALGYGAQGMTATRWRFH